MRPYKCLDNKFMLKLLTWLIAQMGYIIPIKPSNMLQERNNITPYKNNIPLVRFF